MRAIAVTLVVLHHAEVPGFRGGGIAGVTIFFVLSGSLITAELLRTDRSLVAFAWRRIRRIYPAMLVLLAVVTSYGAARGRATAYLWRALAAGAGSMNWVVRPGVSMFQLGHLWTIGVELQFYMGCAIAVFVLRRSLPALTALAVAVVLVASALRFWAFDSWGWQRIYLGTDTRADAFAMGALLALFLPRSSVRSATRLTLLAAAAVTLGWVAMTGSQTDRATLLVGLPAAVAASTCLVVALRIETVPPVLAPLAGLGRISYSVYLWHFPIIRTLLDDDPIPHELWITVLCLASIGAGAASYALVERRFWAPSFGVARGKVSAA